MRLGFVAVVVLLLKVTCLTPVKPLRSTLFLIFAVMHTKAASTLLPLSALVSTKGIPSSFARLSPSSVPTCRSDKGKSTLFPTSTVSRSWPPSSLARSYQVLTCSNESRRPTSYTNSAPWAPL